MQVHPGELRSQNQWVHIVLEASKSVGAKDEVCAPAAPMLTHSLLVKIKNKNINSHENLEFQFSIFPWLFSKKNPVRWRVPAVV